MNEIAACTFCGGDQWDGRRVEYLYGHQGKYLPVPNTPAQACARCGILYYAALVLKQIEEQFFAITQQREQPDRLIEIPEKAFV